MRYLALFITLFLVVIIPYLCYISLVLSLGFRKSPAKKDTSYKPTISIIIPTHNEELIIGKKLDNIFELEYPRELLEVVIADSSDDKTPQIIKGYQERYNCICYIREKKRGLATALNKAYAKASGDIVIKTDCDSFLKKDALIHMAANFADPRIGGVTGDHVVLNESKVEEGYRSLLSKVQVAESWVDSTIIFHGPCSAYRRGLVVKIDPRSLADDSELAIKVRKQGYKTILDPEIKFYEASQSQFLKRRKQKDRRGRGLIRLLNQHRDVLFNKNYGKYGSIIFPMNYFMMILSPYLLVILFAALLAFALANFGILGSMILVGFLIFVYLGQSDRLHSLEPLYSFVDTQISLLVGGLSLLFCKGDSKWEVDKELREVYLKDRKKS